MISLETAHTLAGICGNATALILFLSPVPTMVTICKKKSVLQYTTAPYLATFFNCGLWLLYSMPMVHPQSFLVMTINGAGVFIELIYLTIFFLYSDNKRKFYILVIFIGEIVFMAALFALDLHFAHTWKRRSIIIGSIATIGSILMYAAPLAVMKLVITTKSVEYMPLFLSICSLANASIWTIFGSMKFDPFIVGPNGVGVLLALVQLVIYAMYSDSDNIVEEKQVDLEVGMTKKQLSVKKTFNDDA